ncbi:hypothetical protein [Natrialba taiwanensis]|uniref:hypothetical protein n=1 Tax=Natrialba taiwanensis TaxID=160846 RepID=UPI000B0B20AC|nr:hypothetical protein [Natrialba taiwanensis]
MAHDRQCVQPPVRQLTTSDQPVELGGKSFEHASAGESASEDSSESESQDGVTR